MYFEQLKALRERYGLSQREVGEILKLSTSQYGNYETGYAIIPSKNLIKLCDYYNVSLDYIFKFTNTRKYSNSKNDVNMKISGTRIKEFRKEHKMNQSQFANFLNVAFSTISAYERGIYLIATPFLYQICKTYNVSADYLLGKVDSPKYINKDNEY